VAFSLFWLKNREAWKVPIGCAGSRVLPSAPFFQWGIAQVKKMVFPRAGARQKQLQGFFKA